MTSLKKYMKQLNEESGVTLVELLAAIAVLSLVVTYFLAFFVQAGRTNQLTTEVNEATFLAQEEMERVTYLSSRGELSEDTQATNHSNSSYFIETSVSTVESPLMYKVIVRINENAEGGKVLALMETRLPISNEESD